VVSERQWRDGSASLVGMRAQGAKVAEFPRCKEEGLRTLVCGLKQGGIHIWGVDMIPEVRRHQELTGAQIERAQNLTAQKKL